MINDMDQFNIVNLHAFWFGLGMCNAFYKYTFDQWEFIVIVFIGVSFLLGHFNFFLIEHATLHTN